MQWPMIKIVNELPPNPNPERTPDEVYQAFAGLTIPVVTPFGDYRFWCPFVPEAEMAEVEGVMSSAEMVMQALEDERPQAAGWFSRNRHLMACDEPEGGRPLMVVFPAGIEADQADSFVGCHDAAIHIRDRQPAA
jgi:hypothetical protein